MRTVRVSLLFVVIILLAILASCQPITPNSTTNPSRSVTATPSPTFIRTPDSTGTPSPTIPPTSLPTRIAHLAELAVLGQGTLPHMVYSKDGTRIYLSDGKEVRVLNAADDTEITRFTLPGEELNGILGVSPDGSMVIVDGLYTFHVVEVSRGNIRGSGYAENGPKLGPVFSPDGKYVVYLAANHTSGGPYDCMSLLRLNNHPSSPVGEFDDNGCYPVLHPYRYHEHTFPVVSPDGRWVAAGYADSTNNILYIWDLEQGTILHEIKGQPAPIRSVAFSPDGSWLASAGNDGVVRLWDPKSGRLERTITAFVDAIQNIQFSADSRSLVVSVTNLPPVVFELSSNRISPLIPEPHPPLARKLLDQGYILPGAGSKVRFSPDGQTVAVAHGSLQVWDVQSGDLLAALIPESGLLIAGLIYSPDGSHLAAVTQDGSVYAWDIRSSRQVFYIPASTLLSVQVDYFAGGSDLGPGIGAGVWGESVVAFSPDIQRIALPNGAAIEVWDIATSSRALILDQTQPVAFPNRITYSADGHFIYAALNRNRDLAVWEARTGKLVRQIGLPAVDPNAFTATDLVGPWFARNNYANKRFWVELWNIETGKMTLLATNQRAVEPLRFSPDGKYLAALVNREQVHLWRTDTGELVFLSKKEFDIGDLAVSPGGSFLATALYGKLTLWDLSRVAYAASQTGFATPVLPPTATPWGGSISDNKTTTPPPTQVVDLLPTPVLSEEGLNVVNLVNLQAQAQLGLGKVSYSGWSSDGQELLVASSTGVYQLNAQTLRQTHRFKLDDLDVTSIQIFPGGRILAAGITPGGNVQAWDLVNLELLVELPGQGQPALSPDGRWLVYKGIEGLNAWNLETGQPGLLLRSRYAPNSPVFRFDSRYVAAIQSDRSIRVWEIETGVIVNAIGGPEAPISQMAFSPDGNYLVGAAGGTAWMWSMRPSLLPFKVELFDGEINNNLTLFDGTVTAVAVTTDNQLLAIGDSQRRIWLYNRATGQRLSILHGHVSVPVQLAFSPNGLLLFSLDADGQMIVWDVAAQKQVVSAHMFSGIIRGLVEIQDGSISAWMQNTVLTLDSHKAFLKRIVYLPVKQVFAASPRGDLLAGYTPLNIALYDANTGQLSLTLPEEPVDTTVEHYHEGKLLRQFYGALFTPDGTRLATFGMGGFWLYSVPGGDLIGNWEWIHHTFKAAFSPDGEWLVASNFELGSAPHLLDVSTWDDIYYLDSEEHADGADYSQYAVSPDKRWVGLLLKMWNDPTRFILVDTSSGMKSGQVEFENDQLLCLAFHPSSRLAAVGSQQGYIYLVDLYEMKVVHTLTAHPNPITALLFTSDGLRLASAGSDGIIKIWGLP